ncbi:GATA transcription factor 9-like [Phalaenopsis equestris]|uniref:GATA transcription factor 9-like n=1 Tax=Phalaenopsis equestris TaxID=78828 RepID=UPI0009E30E40|nr:GATA transcription factor 9-like [Phalaenopsis equestris]
MSLSVFIFSPANEPSPPLRSFESRNPNFDREMESNCRAGTALMSPEKQGKAGGDPFLVEELLDLSGEEEEDTEMMAAEEDGRSEETGGNCSADSCANSFSGGGSQTRFSDELVYRSLADVGLSGELCEPHEEEAELEWLSNFVEDSFSTEELHKHHLISGLKSASSPPAHANTCPFTASDDLPPFAVEAPLPGKARSKRSRSAPCDWSSRLRLLSKTATKKNKRPSLAALSPSSDGRRCLHCETDKTPQWRAGPMGPKTLCNACGVRFKSGRLVPEYRPALSPTFVLSKHSNSHRKVLELRRQKEIQEQQQFLLPVSNKGAAEEVEDEFLISGGEVSDEWI